jgi:hypothetical protein
MDRFKLKFPHDTQDTETREMMAVFATAPDGKVYRVDDPKSYSRSLLRWSTLEDLRRKGRFPHVKHFEVRTVFVGPDRPIVGPTITSHDRYDGAPLDMLYATPVLHARGFGKAEDAARAAWKRAHPTFRSFWDKRAGRDTRTGVQGLGGWFYYSNGETAVQGLRSLAKLCKAKRMIVEADGRFYVTTEPI